MKLHDCQSEWCYECCNCVKCGEESFDLLVDVKRWYDADDKAAVPQEIRARIDRFLAPREK